MSDSDTLKREAAERAVTYIQSGMVVGLGTGSTAVFAVRRIGALLAAGELQGIVGIPTAEVTAREAERCGVPLGSLDDYPAVDITIDGADEIDPRLNLIKGLGGALLREKIVAAASREMIVIADETKAVATLGRFPLPVEVIDFGLEATRRAILRVAETAGCRGEMKLRKKADGHVFVTDQGHLILDAHFGRIPDAPDLARGLAQIPGVVEHGLFIGLATRAILAGSEGIRVVERP